MDSAVSVSKGCFVFKKSGKKKSSNKHVSSKEHFNEKWYQQYKKLWNCIESKTEDIHNQIHFKVLQDLINFVKNSHNMDDEMHDKKGNEIPAATLLTGVNLPDHDALFLTLFARLKEEITSHVAILKSRDCGSVRSTIESMTSQLMGNSSTENMETDLDEVDFKGTCTKRNKYNFLNFKDWYANNFPVTPRKSPKKRKKIGGKSNNRIIVIIVPDLESFPSNVIQDFILIASGHADVIPIVLIFGIATAMSALHHTLPYHVTSKLNIQVDQAETSTALLNKVIEEVLLACECPFRLGNKTFQLLMDVFLFYDLSVNGFINGFKYCMMEHFFGNDINILCCNAEDITDCLQQLSSQDLEKIKQLPSVKKYMETTFITEKKFKSNNFKDVLEYLLQNFHLYLFNFHVGLKILQALMSTLPKAPLGKQIREIYNNAVSNDLRNLKEFKDGIQLLNFQAKEELKQKLIAVNNVIDASLNESPENNLVLQKMKHNFDEFSNEIQNERSLENEADIKSPSKTELVIGERIDRFKLKEKLLEYSQKLHRVSPYEAVRDKFLKYVNSDFVTEVLKPYSEIPLHEIMIFDDIIAVKSHIVGAPRAAIHIALKNPHHYLQCTCCELPDDSAILPSLPDISIVYKLHLESGKLINLYDWLQAFLMIVDPNHEEENQGNVDPVLQARFTRAVTELQFLGFIKPSGRKTDHVMRLT